MRILFVNQYFPPDASATAYLLGELAEDLADRHEVWVVAGRPSYNPDVSTFRPRGVHLARTWSTTFARAGLLARAANYSTFLATALVRSMRGPRPDVVVAMTDPPFIGLIGLLSARRYHVPFVYVCMDIFPDVGVALGHVDNPVVVKLWRLLNRVLRNGAARVIAIGRDMAEKLEAEGVPAAKIAFLPNWGNEPSHHRHVDAVREQMGWHGKQVIMHAGNMGLAQNLEIVLDAAERLRYEAPEVQFVFMGDGAARARLMDEAQRRMLVNVMFLDYRPKEDAESTIAAANLHLISLAPGLKGAAVPSKVYGVLAAGLPFIAVVDEDSEIDRIIQDYGCGLQVEPADSEHLVKSILAAAEQDLREMGARSRLAFDERYSRPIATAGYRDMLESVADMCPERRDLD